MTTTTEAQLPANSDQKTKQRCETNHRGKEGKNES